MTIPPGRYVLEAEVERRLAHKDHRWDEMRHQRDEALKEVERLREALRNPHRDMPTRWVRWWQRMIVRSLCIEVVYFHGDDETETRVVDAELRFPKVLFRPRCWTKGHESYYGECVFCGKRMP